MTDNNETWTFYIIYNQSATYAGISNDYIQRLRKHNGEISGGAIYTTSRGPGWKHLCIVNGFQTKSQCLMFEWAVKHVAPRNAGGLKNRVKKLYAVLNKKNWTSKSPDASTVPLTLEWKIPFDFTGIERNVPAYVTDVDFCCEK
jgi:predicted GIY-YIG superfamily endonuclease